MAKNKVIKKDELEDVFDFSTMLEPAYEEEIMTDMMKCLVESGTQQMRLAFELTQLIVEKNPSEKMTEEQILASFKRASKAVTANFPMEGLWDKWGK